MRATGRDVTAVQRARLGLFLTTFLWGSTFVAVQTALKSASPFVLLALRFGLAAASLVLIRPHVLRDFPRLLPKALGLGLATTAGFVLQTAGLTETTPSRSAFLTALFVVIVPFFEAITKRRFPKKALLASVALAVFGVWVLFAPASGAWTRGDTMTVLCALAFAVYVMEVDRLGRVHDAFSLTFAQFAVVTVVSVLLIPTQTARLVWTPQFAGVLAYLATVCSTLAIVIASKYQPFVSPTEASVLYTTEPVIAAVLSVALGREPFSMRLVLGGAIVVVATGLAGLASIEKKTENKALDA